MSTWNAIYLGESPPADYRLPIEGALRLRRVGTWHELELPGSIDAEALAVALSRQVAGHVVWVQLQTAASVLGVMHCEGGAVIRHIGHGDGGWQLAEGQPQPWEEWLFSDAERQSALEDAEPGQEAEIHAAFDRRQLVIDQYYPAVREWDACLQVLGVSDAEWAAAHAQPPLRVLEGSGRSRATLVVRGALFAAMLCIAGMAVTRGSARAGLLALAGALLLVTLLAALSRRMSVGRWVL